MRKLIIISMLIILFLLIPIAADAWTLPDIKQSFVYKARARELSLGVSFELWQQGRYSLELQLANNFVGFSVLYHYVPLVEISSGFTGGWDVNKVRFDGGLILIAWISW